MDGWMDGWMDGQTDRQKDRKTDRQTKLKMYELKCLFSVYEESSAD